MIMKRTVSVVVRLRCDGCNHNEVALSVEAEPTPEGIQAAIRHVEAQADGTQLQNRVTGQVWLTTRGKHFCSWCRQSLEKRQQLGV